MKSKDRKGQVRLADAPGVVLVLVLLGIFLTVGGLILAEFQDAQETTGPTRNVVNETFLSPTGDGGNLTVDNAGLKDFVGTFEYMSNASFYVIPAANYSTTRFASEGIIQLLNTSDSGDINVTYSFTETERDAFFNATEDSLTGLTTVSGFTTIIAVVIAAAIILGLVFLIR